MQRGASFKSKGDWQSKSNRFLLGMALFLCIMLISCENKPKENAVFDLLVLRTELENNGSNYSEKTGKTLSTNMMKSANDLMKCNSHTKSKWKLARSKAK